MKAMIFAAGLGTRLRPLTDNMPKALVTLAGKTLLQWQIEKLRSAGVRDIVVNVHHFPDMIIDYLDEHKNFDCSVRVSDEREKLLDTGGGLRHARSLLVQEGDEPILVCNVDILSNIDLKLLLSSYRRTELGLLVVSERSTQRYLLFDDQNRLHGWTNIATGEVRPGYLSASEEWQSMKRYAFSGMQVLSPRVFDLMDDIVKEKGDCFSLIDLYLSVAKEEVLRAYVPSDYKMMDVGKIGQLHDAEVFAESMLA